MGNLIEENINQYIEDHTSPQDDILAALDRHTNLNFLTPQMLSGQVQGKFLEMVVHMLQPKRILEIGTYTGYSAICFAKALPADGRLITIDINDELTTTIQQFIKESGFESKIELRIGQALDIIPQLNETFDLVFIDADKPNYSNYFDACFDKIRVGGFMMADNVLWSGNVVEEKINPSGHALRAFAKKVQEDSRVENVMLSIRDGIMLVRKVKD